MREIWTWAEVWGEVEELSLMVAGEAREIAEKLSMGTGMVLMGSGLEEVSHKASAYADRIYVMDDEALKFYDPYLFSENLSRLIREREPYAVLFGATEVGKDLAGRTSAKLGTGVVSHVIRLIDEIKGEVPGWGGNIALIIGSRTPFIATMKVGKKLEGERGEVIKLKPFTKETPIKIEGVERKEIREEFSGAKFIIGVGWGARGIFEKIKELSRLTGGAIGATRPVVDEGLVPKERMIGQSGKIVSPEVFLSLGASGQPQFTSGFSGSGFIISVDRDPKAPIFEISDLGFVGDVEEIVKRLLEELG